MPASPFVTPEATALPHVLQLRHLMTRARMLAARDAEHLYRDAESGAPEDAAIRIRHVETCALVETLRAVCDAPPEALPRAPIELMMVPPGGGLAAHWVRLHARGDGEVEVLPTPVTREILREEAVSLMYLATQALARHLADHSGVALPWPTRRHHA